MATKVGLALAVPTPKLRVYPYGTPKIEAPAAVFVMPESIDYHQAYGTGLSKLEDAAVMVLVRDLARRTAFKSLADYAAPTGPGSVKAALEGYAAGTTWDALTVSRVDFDTISMGTASYLAALFHLTIVGTGA